MNKEFYLRRKLRGEGRKLFSRFEALDKNNDGLLTKEELKKARTPREVINHLTKKTKDLYISKKDIKEYVKECEKERNRISHEFEPIIKRFNACLQNIKENPKRELYLLDQDENPIIGPECIRQHKLGDCHFLAAVAFLAKHRPEDIKNMITKINKNKYKVKFPGKSVIFVDTPTDGELGLYTGGQDGTWPAVLEKAFAMYHNKKSKRVDPYKSIEDGICQGIEILTGNSYDIDYTFSTTCNTHRSKIKEALKIK